MKKILFVIFSLSLTSVFAIARPQPISISGQGWLKLSCHGIVSPRYAHPTVERHIMDAHLKINAYAKYPSLEDVRDQNSDFFKNLTKVCTERRRAKVEFGNFTGVWLDWGTDWAYSRLTMSETFIPSTNTQCRSVGSPCERVSQCCGYSTRMASCNIQMNTCESLMISASTSNIIKSN